ncbi:MULTISPECIES: DUF6095 family protein [unclassified Polaribacter]|uniref:DUF6095 family protein n=1 Tax=unclassified Polaribacter TaxID=196858 RepID=UPI0011BE147D|nr:MULTISPECIES: DUF6095 family protein [unclassified Polaribacter]TXD51475.1 hypothetical protein ES043_11820 [Polaribacter sp. IC063]TXD61797.1 hypothetical protein ES044_03500 [Polaribacter sp. IC066]
MSTDTNLLSKGLIRLGILVFLFIASPITITMGFKAFDRFTEAPKIYFAYLILVAGCVLFMYTLYFAFKTFAILRKAIFTDN